MDIKIRLVIGIQQQFFKVLWPKIPSALCAPLVIFRLYHFVQTRAAVNVAAVRHNNMVPVVQNFLVISQANRTVVAREKIVRFAAFIQALHPVLQVVLIEAIPRRPVPGGRPREFFLTEMQATARNVSEQLHLLQSEQLHIDCSVFVKIVFVYLILTQFFKRFREVFFQVRHDVADIFGAVDQILFRFGFAFMFARPSRCTVDA